MIVNISVYSAKWIAATPTYLTKSNILFKVCEGTIKTREFFADVKATIAIFQCLNVTRKGLKLNQITEEE